ncbi:MAG: glycosyltransferase family 4 protein [Candidatus Thorarchaeota archaeon]
MPGLKDRKLLVAAPSFPNSDNSSVTGIFIKNQVEGVCNYLSDVTVIVPVSRRWGLFDRDPSRTDYSFNDVRVIFPKTYFIPRGGLKRFAIDKFQLGIRKAISKHNVEFDLMHSHYGIMGRSCFPISQEHKIPLITSFYGYDAYINAYDLEYYRDLFENTTLVLALSDHMSNRLKKLGCPDQKIRKLHVGVDTGYFQPKEQHSELGDDGVLRILLVAFFDERKGILDAINAFAKVQKDIKYIHFDIVGRGKLKNQIESLIISLDLQDKITITNNISTPNPIGTVLDFMQNCDIFILPSFTSPNGDSEGTPVVLMEASACGKPCITTFHSGNPEVVLNDETGLVVPERNIQELEKALRKMIINEELRKRLGNNARKRILAEFNTSIQSRKLAEIYEDVLE